MNGDAVRSASDALRFVGLGLSALSLGTMVMLPIAGSSVLDALGVAPLSTPPLHGPDYVAPPPHIPVS